MSTRRQNASGLATRRHILATAERLFAERGLDAVSTREITAAAGVNSAAIYYHFGTKRDLIAAILELRANDIAARRATVLSELEASSDPQLREVVHALVVPWAQLATSADGRNYLGFLGDVLRHTDLMPLVHEYYDAHIDRYLELLKRVTPHLSDDERILRFVIAKEVTNAVYTGMGRAHFYVWLGDRAPHATDRLEDRLVDYLTAAFAGPETRPS